MMSAADTARWMVARVIERHTYYVVDLLRELPAAGGAAWVDATRRGRRTIHPRVLRRFRVEHGGAISWDPLGQCWTGRRPG
jgi:hypothetical protein